MEALSANKIKEIKKLHQKKYRDEFGLFIAEGEKALQDILKAKVETVNIFATQKFNNCYKNVSIISESDMKKISTTSSPCEVLAIAKKKQYDIRTFNNYNNILLLDSVSDPGNLGTIIRSSAAFGVDAVILFGNCVELYSPKVIRSCAGNFFKIPISFLSKSSELKNYFSLHKFISTDLSNSSSITFKQCSKINKKILMFGSEARGLHSDLIKLSDYNIRLDMKNSVESLNLAVSASIILYELNEN